VIVRIFLWNLANSKTTLDELREQLPGLESGDTWISNEAGERFGLITFSRDVPSEVSRVRELIGRDPDVGEEFDVEAEA
jgi:hypothetical protein